MKLHNKTGFGLQHVITKTDKEGRTKRITYTLAHDEAKEIPQEVADVWLKINGVKEYVEPADVEKIKKEAEAKAKAEKETLGKENAALKAELEKLKEAEAKASKTKK